MVSIHNLAQQHMRRDNHLSRCRQGRGSALHAVLYQEEAREARHPGLWRCCEVWRHLQLRGKLQLPVAVVVLLEGCNPAQRGMHMDAPAGNMKVCSAAINDLSDSSVTALSH